MVLDEPNVVAKISLAVLVGDFVVVLVGDFVVVLVDDAVVLVGDFVDVLVDDAVVLVGDFVVVLVGDAVVVLVDDAVVLVLEETPSINGSSKCEKSKNLPKSGKMLVGLLMSALRKTKVIIIMAKMRNCFKFGFIFNIVLYN